jgi:hypothetical protein
MKRLKASLATIAHYCTQAWAWISCGRGKRALYSVARVDDEPRRLNARVLYIVEDAGIAWSAIMACPCRCGAVLHMNLIPDAKPVWRLDQRPDGVPSLTPSVWRMEGCRSHFFLRDGRIEWCDRATWTQRSVGTRALRGSLGQWHRRDRTRASPRIEQR